MSGSEPTLCKEHLLRVLDLIPEDIQFVLETNGILIGHDEDHPRALAMHENLHVRVSLKGTSEGEFSCLTGAEPVGFALRLKALESLLRAGVSSHAAAMVSFSQPEKIEALQERLAGIAKELVEIEIEELVFFNPGVEERLRKQGWSTAPLSVATISHQSRYRVVLPLLDEECSEDSQRDR